MYPRGSQQRYGLHFNEYLTAKTLIYFLQLAISPTTIVLFVVSTFGNGDPPSDARPFSLELDKLLEKEKSEQPPTRFFNGLRYGVCALGSSNYPNFCAYGKNLDKNLSDLGAHRLLEVNNCDEVSQSEKSFNSWLDNINALLTESRRVRV